MLKFALAFIFVLLFASASQAQSFAGAKSHRHTVQITMEFSFIGLTQRGPISTVGEQFFGNTVTLKTDKGKTINLFFDFASSIATYARLTITRPGTLLLVTYDPECGMIARIGFPSPLFLRTPPLKRLPLRGVSGRAG